MASMGRPTRPLLDPGARGCIFGCMRSIAALALCPLLLGLPAAAANVEAGYTVRWAGIEIGRFEIVLRSTPDDYHLAYQAATTGAVAWFFDFTSDGTANGRLTPAGPSVDNYEGRSVRDGDRVSRWQVAFAPDGTVAEVVLDDESRGDREPVPAELMVAPDPFTLAFRGLLAAAADKRLEGRSFDGKRAMDFYLDCAPAPAPVHPAAFPAPRGGALFCTADGELLAGRSKRWGDRTDDHNRDRPPARLWLAPDIGGVPHWPVRIEAEGRFGAVTIELDHLVEPAA